MIGMTFFSGSAGRVWAVLSALALTLVLGTRTESCSSEPTTAAPVWSDIPAVSLKSGGSTSISLNDFVSDADTADAELILSAYGGSSTTVNTTVSATSHILTLQAASTYTGTTNIQVQAEDAEGSWASTVVAVTVTAGSTGGTSSLAFTSVTNGGTYTNPLTFKVNASTDITLVKYLAAWTSGPVALGESSDRASGFAVSYSFSDSGSRTITAEGYTSSGAKAASATVTLTVSAGTGTSSVKFTSPTNGATLSGAVSFKASGSADIKKVVYSSPYNGQSYTLGESTDVTNQFPVSYTFSSPGTRQINADGYNGSNVKVASASLSITSSGSEPTSSSSEGGLGAWLWYIEGTGYTHSQLATKLAGLGVQRIYIKVADGTDLWPEATNSSIPATYQAQGIEAWAWSYNYLGSYSTQANALYSAAKFGYDGFVLDIEIEYDGKTTELHSLLGAFRDARTKAQGEGRIETGWPMYATTWGNPKDHNMHVEIIDQYVDGHMPQTYLEVWGSTYMADPSYWVDYGTQEYRSMGAKKPIHHIVSTEYDKITATQINEFFATSGCESSIWRVPGNETPTSIWNDWAAVDWDQCAGAASAAMSWVSPKSGGVYLNGIWFKVSASTAVKTVKYYADSYFLGESTDASQSFAVKYTFSTLGERTVQAYGYDAAGTKLGQISVTFTVTDSSGSTGNLADVPYYYQYNNSINPSGSCQNTSLAMVLTFYGCTVTPDTISAAWGTSYAQEPSGLAAVFNSYASKCGIKQRMVAHYDGTVSNVTSLLAAGKPVIVHGYFTSYGHVVVLVGYDGTYYSVNDPAGIWKETFKGGYYASDSNDGDHIKYDKAPVVQAINTLDGYSTYPIWYHEITP